MKQKTLSSTAKNSAPQHLNLDEVMPRQVFSERLNETDLDLLGTILDACCDLSTVFFSQKTIGKKIGRCRMTVSRSIKKLTALGLIHKFNRNYQTCLYTINKILLSPKWHKELYHWFRRYPAMIIPLAISLLFSPAAAKQGGCYTILSGSSGCLVFKRHTTEGYPSGKPGMPAPPQTETKKESNNVEQINYRKAKKVRGIALALNKRGAKLSNYEAIGIMAYDDTALDLASARMRDSKGLRNPAAFFLSLCKRHTQDLGCLPDWDMVRYMRDNAVRLLTPDEETAALLVTVSDNAMGSGPLKREPSEQTYSEQVKRGQAREQKAAEERKPAHLKGDRTVLSLEAELKGWKEAVAAQAAKHKDSPMQPFFNGMALNHVERLEKELRELFQFSNTAHDDSMDNSSTSVTPGIVSPGANLKMF